MQYDCCYGDSCNSVEQVEVMQEDDKKDDLEEWVMWCNDNVMMM